MGPSSATQLVALLDVGHSMAAAEWSSISSDIIKTNGTDARAAAASAGPKGVPPSVFEKVKEGRDNA